MENKALAVVEGKTIYDSDLDQLIEQAPKEQQGQFRTADGRRQLLDEMIAQELFYLEAKKEKLDESEEYQKMVTDAKEKLLKSLAITEYMKAITVDDEELKAYYDENPDQFKAPYHIRASHILLPAEQQAIDIIGEINAGGKTFEEAATAYSVCPSKEKGGDLGYFPRGKMIPAFDEVAFNMEVGTMTEKPVQSDFGWHIIKVTDEKKDEDIPFEQVKDSLRNFLLGQKQNQAFLKRTEELKEEYDVEMKTGLF